MNEGVTRFTREILFDEKIGGTVHMAVGSAYPETGSTNQSGLHWDMVCDLRGGGEILADGELESADGGRPPTLSCQQGATACPRVDHHKPVGRFVGSRTR